MKKCPLCIEDIHDDAQVCKHCGTDMKSLGQKKSLLGGITQALFTRRAEDVSGIHLKYRISFRSCRYRWIYPNALMEDMINSSINNSDTENVRDLFLMCSELKSLYLSGEYTPLASIRGIV